MSLTGQRTLETKTCAVCGETFAKRAKLTRAQWDRAWFCSNKCLGLSRRTADATRGVDGRYYVIRNGKRIPRARAVVEDARGPLAAGSVVHHVNRDRADDRLENLRVFASHAEHMRFHAAEGDCGFQPGHPPHQQRHADEWPPDRRLVVIPPNEGDST